MYNRRSAIGRVVSTIALATLMACGINAQAADYPGKPIRIAVPYPAGGGTDTIARLMSSQLSQRWGQPLRCDL